MSTILMLQRQEPPPPGPTRHAYKLFTYHADGRVGPLFIHRPMRIDYHVWYPAEDHPTKGFAHRPGWHVSPEPSAPHLTERGRIWAEVEIADWRTLQRPACQGGTWLLANWMRLLRLIPNPSKITP